MSPANECDRLVFNINVFKPETANGIGVPAGHLILDHNPAGLIEDGQQSKILTNPNFFSLVKQVKDFCGIGFGTSPGNSPS